MGFECRAEFADEEYLMLALYLAKLNGVVSILTIIQIGI